MTEQFRMDNTEGYSAADLAELNRAWNVLTAHDHLLGLTDEEDAIGRGGTPRLEYHKNLSERLLAAFDAGKRGDDLTDIATI